MMIWFQAFTLLAMVLLTLIIIQNRKAPTWLLLSPRRPNSLKSFPFYENSQK